MTEYTYNGNDVFAPFNAGLYGIDDRSDAVLLIDETKKEIERCFDRDYGAQIRTALEAAGMRFVRYEFYSPRFYNYSTDSLDLVLEVVDDVKYRAWCEAHKDEIQAALDANKSYDGYMAKTAQTYAEAWFKYDITIVRLALSGIEFSPDDIYEWLVWEYACDTCERIHAHDLEYGDDAEKEAVRKCEASTVRV